MSTYGELFAGIGGMSLGLERAGWEPRFFAEIDPYCSRVLAKHWPHVPNMGDVTKIRWVDVPEVDLLCGGFPCQPFSSAGLRKGASDDRYLWPEIANAVGFLRPRFVLLENVPGLLRSPEFGEVLGDLAHLGYDAEWGCVPAAAFGAPHLRWRVFVVAYPTGMFGVGGTHHGSSGCERVLEVSESGNGGGVAPSRSSWWASEPDVGRVADWSAVGVDRLRVLGNAVVPQVAEWIGRQLLAHLDQTEGTS